MATADFSLYSKGVLVGSEKDWFHGELTTVQANHALTVYQRDCFLVRADQGALVLSLSHHGQLHHIKIKYGTGWYELESGSAQYSFTELEELVSHYRETVISDDLKFTLGEVCQKLRPDPFYETISDLPLTILEATPHHYDYISSNIYSKGEPEDLMKYMWYHGNITQDQADAAISIGDYDKFLVQSSSSNLILSKSSHGRLTHKVIHYSPKGYRLDGDSMVFHSVPEIIAHYKQSLGTPVTTLFSGSQRKVPHRIFQKEAEVLQVSWKRCADLPVSFSLPHVVKIGEDIYVGGGVGECNDALRRCVFKYSVDQDVWTPLPPCETHMHGLTTLNSELIAVGGAVHGVASNAVRTFRDGEWNEVLPPMPTPRWSLSTLSHGNNIIIAAGGIMQSKIHERIRVDVVELYIDNRSTWYTASQLKFPLVQFISCIVKDTVYVLGGTGRVDHLKATLYTSVPSLLESALPADSKCLTPPLSTSWKQLKGQHPLVFCTPVKLAGRLVTMGGCSDLRLRRGTRFISTYDFATDTWVECKGAVLPAPLYRPGVLKLDDSRVMIVGGQPWMEQFSTAAYIGRYETIAK